LARERGGGTFTAVPRVLVAARGESESGNGIAANRNNARGQDPFLRGFALAVSRDLSDSDGGEKLRKVSCDSHPRPPFIYVVI